MAPARRYALFYIPPSDQDWARFAAKWLGWDIEAGQSLPQPDRSALPLPMDQITQSPRKYGLHATLKPPFRLADGCDPDDLMTACATLCSDLKPVQLSGLSLTRLGRFLALCPVGPTDAMNALAARCVRDLDGFRAGPDHTELARRRHRGLSAAQETNLIRWGYPHVMEQFQFHITLTGRLPKPVLPDVRAVLEQLLTPLLPAPLTISHLALVGEAADGQFHLTHRFALGE